ncbi:ADP-ribosylglycohydrolase family protein [Maribacter sp. ACAM166]|uniref:ADP-ribosylglycohydrolase family protein n=1 Tax=Maribacter sp. ACAM166 TaxID=2508996 RepID=UPI0010FEB74C|nr:ADP-ribosylglycohydrolase family protein [Maribacter sp. ACAM166]TLP82750.1 ADP-ribosylglycohydrolase family protein [Maribacter sp. ACAM166]
MRHYYILIFFFTVACKNEVKTFDIPSPTNSNYESAEIHLADSVYYDKVLGALVGSAIGDAMGASTEMWHRKDIQLSYGYINGLTAAVREQSPEGIWEHNLLSGATTDDTRWKSLMVHYFKANHNTVTPDNFALFIIEYYNSLTKALANKDIQTSTDALDAQIEKIDWIKEWARVAMAYKKDKKSYLQAQNRFYGGEMSCAGQLYTPMIGLISKSPLEAYQKAYDLSLFDIGYAKDISALVSTMTHMALRTQEMDSIMNSPKFIDPIGYADSRLVGRIPNIILDGAQKNVRRINQLVLIDSLLLKDSIVFRAPKGYAGSKIDWVRQEMLYQLLEKDKRSIAFHSAEIWQILVTGLEFGNGDFEKTMQFIVNYGRDNDTVAAVAGMILGAKLGYKELPQQLRETILNVNKENLGIDLEALAKEMVQ